MKKLPLSQIQTHLTFESAQKFGYVFIGEVNFKIGNPSIKIDDDIHYLLKFGFKLGQPKSLAENQNFLGLYRPSE